jgi:hypothetical protein
MAEFFKVLKEEENARLDGFDKESGTWMPHKSAEGGTDTIGWGHKLTPAEQTGGYIVIEGEKVPFAQLTMDKADRLLKQDFNIASNKAKNWIGKGWDTLSEDKKTLAAELAYNVKSYDQYDLFKKKVLAGDDSFIDEINRGYKDKKNNYIPLTKRTNALKNWYKEQGKAPGVNSYEQYMQAAENENAALMPTYGAPKVAAAPAVSPNFNVAGGYNPNKVAESLPTLKPREVITETETVTEEGPGFIDRIKSGFKELYPFNEGGAVNNTYTTNYTPGGTVNQAQGLASLGRGGDSTLVHMQPQEVAGLQQLAQANGTSLTRNPMTGYPEAFSLGGMFKAGLPIAAGYFTGGAGTGLMSSFGSYAPLAAGAATGAGIAAATGDDPIMGAVSGGLGGMSGGNLNTAMMGPTNATGMKVQGSLGGMAGASPYKGAATGTAMPGYSFPQTQTSTVGVSGLETGGGALPDGTIPQTDVVKQIPSGGSGSIGMPRQGAVDFSGSFSDGIDQVYRNLGTVDPTTGLIKDAGNLEVAKTLGAPVASMGLGGLEESDFINTPDFDDPRDKYNPYSKLNLSNDTGISEAMSRDTGLRLLAKGGYLQGPGDGMSDDIPATINGDEPAALADGEFVVPADVVSHLGNGSSEAGSKQLYAMMDRIRKARTGRESQGKEIKPGKYMPR